jgi:hypothetical protein
MRAIAPESYQIEIRGVEHEFNSDEHEDRVAPRECSGQANRKQESGHE